MTRTIHRPLVSLLSILMLAASMFVLVPASPVGATPTTPVCIKFDSDELPAAVVGATATKSGVTITVSQIKEEENGNDEILAVSFTSDTPVVSAAVKAGTATNPYTFAGATSGSVGSGDNKGISNIVFCFGSSTPDPDPGALKLAKTVYGGGATGTESFIIAVDCDGTAYDQTFTGVTDGWSTTITDIAAGTSCTVEETDTQGADETTYNGTMAASVSVTVAEAQTSTVDVANYYDSYQREGSLKVLKQVTGSPDGSPLSDISVDCDGTAYDADYVDVADGFSATIADIPAGTDCTVTETDASGADSTTVTVDGGTAAAGTTTSVTIAANATRTVLFINHFDQQPRTGQLTVEKAVTGINATGSERFTIDVDCTDDAYDTTFTDVAAGFSQTITGIPASTDCTVTETDDDGASSTTHRVNGGTVTAGASVTETVGADDTDLVVFTNDYPGGGGGGTPPPVDPGGPPPPVDPGGEPTPAPIDVTIDKVNDADESGAFSDSEQASAAGQDVTFRVTVTNDSLVPVVIDSLEDTFDGTTVDLLRGADEGCAAIDDTPLDPGESRTCTFTIEDYAPPAGGQLTNTVTVTAHEDGAPDNADAASDDSEVTSPEDEPVVPPAEPGGEPIVNPLPEPQPVSQPAPVTDSGVLPAQQSRDELAFTGMADGGALVLLAAESITLGLLMLLLARLHGTVGRARRRIAGER